MHKYPIKSTNIVAISYNEITEILEIEFKLNVFHSYINFPLDEFVGLMKADETEEYYLNFVMNNYHYKSL